MEIVEILKQIKALKKGKYVRLIKSKDLGNGVEKFTTMTIRVGVDTRKMKAYEGKEVGQLPWGQWLEGYEGLVIAHKGNHYLRVASACTNTTKSIYYHNEKEITKEQALELVGSKKLASAPSDVYTIRFDNIVEITQA